jgi:hypothetical protein
VLLFTTRLQAAARQDENHHRSNSTLLVRNLFHFSGSVWQLKEESLSCIMVEFIAASVDRSFTQRPPHKDRPHISRETLSLLQALASFFRPLSFMQSNMMDLLSAKIAYAHHRDSL